MLIVALPSVAQKWVLDAEGDGASVEWKKGTATVVAPKGATLWYDELMQGNTVIEYEARIVPDKRFKGEDGALRVSDLNCFWMADTMSPKGGSGRFLNNYALQMYYMGYGGNWNKTTRFRRYNGDERGVEQAEFRPRILKEYTDEAHLLKPNRWYRIRLEQKEGHARYFIDGECLVDYVDPQPLTKGYFGFRTTFAKAQLRNFRYTCAPDEGKPITLKWIGEKGRGVVTFGVPFRKGEKTNNAFTIKTDKGKLLPQENWRLASWDDGSVKWQGFCVNVPEGCDSLIMDPNLTAAPLLTSPEGEGCYPAFYVTLNGMVCPVMKQTTEVDSRMRTITRYEGQNFIIRTYRYKGTDEMKMVHTLLVDSALNHDGLNELSIHFKVPMHGKPYERFVDFDGRKMSVQPLVARRSINLKTMDKVTQSMLANIAQWDGFRLSQLSPNGYSVRKRATDVSPWIGTQEGRRHDGSTTVGDSTMSTSFRLKDFWQSYPSTLQVDNARSDTALVTISLYSPEAEPYSFAHYDTIAHTLEAAYEDVQPGLSTAYGIARTSTIFINKKDSPLMLPTPEYLHSRRAFGIWSLPTVENSRDSLIESTLSGIMDFYTTEIDRNGWYGFFNYGDVMHAYDEFRDEWRYDVGGFAWDNTELGSPAMFWYQFLRTGDAKVWKMAEAMTRHCSEVDTYHFGPHAGLGSRHNVTHWGCGAKESRVSEAWWNRFYYYLSGGDERTGDIMCEVVDSDTLLYTLDPMRLAEPRTLYPCTAPARLRLGPDWVGYASNWLTEYERFGRQKYFDKTMVGMNCIANFPHGFFEGPKALGYDPATGIITNECDSTVQNTNHLMTIMGGFELVNEMEPMFPNPQFYAKWLDHAKNYKQKALEISRNKFLIPRLSGYAGWRLGDEAKKQEAWDDLLNHIPLKSRRQIWTNDLATWTLDAIFLKETIRK